MKKMKQKEGETEILVHINAPSKAADDAKYRTLAAAYLDFEPATRINLLEHETMTEPSSSAVGISSQAQAPSSVVGLSPRASFSSVWDNVGSPSLAGRKRPFEPEPEPEPDQQQGETQDSWVAPPSVIQDSMPDNDISIAAFCSPTRVLGYYLQQMKSSKPTSSQVIYQQGEGVIRTSGQAGSSQPAKTEGYDHQQPSPSLGEEFHEPNPHIRQTPEPMGNTTLATNPSAENSATPPSPLAEDINQTPSSPTLRPPEARATHAASSQVQPAWQPDRTSPNRAWQRQSFDQLVSPITPRAGSETPPLKRQRRSPGSKTSPRLARSVSDVLPRGSKKSTNSKRRHTTQIISDRTNIEEISSNEPKSSTCDLKPTVPEELENLARRLSMEKRFRPSRQEHGLRPFERGYWLLDMNGWLEDIKRSTWCCLGNFIRQDNAGWGTRCCRDTSWNWIRLYGWEHNAGQLYMLLYFSSSEWVVRQGTAWHDGDGKVVIAMSPETGGEEKSLA